jgi:hypothetical protein
MDLRQSLLEGMENKFLKFATSTQENNMIVMEAIKEILR